MNLNQITIPCGDYEESVNFYILMGLRQIVDSPPRYARFETDSGTTFSLHAMESTVSDSGVVIYFEVQMSMQQSSDSSARGWCSKVNR